MRKKYTAKSSLAVTNSSLAKEWAYELNGEKTPENVSKGSNKLYYWVCPNCTYIYPARVCNRVYRESGCPSCNGKVVNEKNCLANNNPELSKEWDYKKNDCTPEQIFKSSENKYYWICPNGHESYLASPANRNKLNGTRCPRCFGKKAYPETSFAANHPDLLKEWNYDKNTVNPEEIKPRSDKDVFWICPKGHDSYRCRVADRTDAKKRTGCPKCARQFKTSFAEQAFYFYIKRVFSDAENRFQFNIDGKNYELDIFVKSLNLGIEYDGFKPHLKNQEKDELKNFIMQEHLQLIRIRECGLPILNLYGSIMIEREDRQNRLAIKPALIELGKVLLNLYTLTNEHKRKIKQWEDINIRIDEQEIYQMFLENTKKECLDTRPDLLEEWDYEKNILDPSKVSVSHRGNVFWICKICGNPWSTSVYHRVYDASSCDKCGYLKRAVSSRKTFAKKRKQFIEDYDLTSPFVTCLKQLVKEGKTYYEIAEILNQKGFRTEGEEKEFTNATARYYLKKIQKIEKEKSIVHVED